MKKHLFIVLCFCEVIILPIWGDDLLIGRTFEHDDNSKYVKIDFTEDSLCVIYQKYYDPYISLEYREIKFSAKYEYKIHRTNKILSPYWIEVKLQATDANLRPIMQLPDSDCHRLDYIKMDYPNYRYSYPNGNIDNQTWIGPWTYYYDNMKEINGWIIVPGAPIKLHFYVFAPDGDSVLNTSLVVVQSKHKSESKSISIKEKIAINQTYATNKHISTSSLIEKPFISKQPFLIEELIFEPDSTCTYIQTIMSNSRGNFDIITYCQYEVIDSLIILHNMYDSIGYGLRLLTPYERNLLSTTMCGWKEWRDGKVRKTPLDSLLWYVNNITIDTLVYFSNHLYYSKVFTLPLYPTRHELKEFIKIGTETTSDIYYEQREYQNGRVPKGKFPVNY